MFFFLLVFMQCNVNGFFFLLPRLPSFSWKCGPAIMSRGARQPSWPGPTGEPWSLGSFIVRLVWFGWQRKCCFLCVFTLCQCFKVKAQPVLHWLAVSFAIRAQWGATVTGYEQSLFEDSDASITATPPTQRHFHTTHTKASSPPPAYLYWTILSLWTCSNWCLFDGLEEMCIWKEKVVHCRKEMWLIYWCSH